MISYEQFSDALSVVLAVQYIVLLGIAIRRSHFRERRHAVRDYEIVVHARAIEGPMLTILLAVALLLLGADLVSGRTDYFEVLKVTVALIRGAMLVGGMWLLAAYWLVRETWLED